MSAVLAVASVIIALIAAGIAALAYRFGWKTWDASKEQNKRDLFLSLHERLSTPAQIQGRILLRQIDSPEEAERVRRDRPEENQHVASALAMLDILGLYVEKGFVDKKLALDEWAPVLADLYPHGIAVIESRERRRMAGTRLWWPHFRSLGLAALSRVDQTSC